MQKVTAKDLNDFDGNFFIVLSPECDKVEEGWHKVNNSEFSLNITIRHEEFLHMLALQREVESLKQSSTNINDNSNFGAYIGAIDEPTKAKRRRRAAELTMTAKTNKELSTNGRNKINQVPDTTTVRTLKAKMISDESKTSSKKPKVVKCEKCGQTCSTTGSLKTHMEIHEEKFPYPCTKCEKAFKQRAGLFQHMNTHIAKRYSCRLCAKKFANAANLSRHKKLHSEMVEGDTEFISLRKKSKEERIFRCNICQKILARNSLLMEHINVHKNLRPYQCDLCPKAFAGKANYFRHKNLHKKRTSSA